MTREEREKYDYYLNLLREYGCVFDDNLAENNFIEKIIDFIPDNSPFSNWDYGCTKLVLFVAGENFVLKIPFNGEEVYNEEEEDYFFEPFYGGGSWYSSDNWDYCLKEAAVYEIAEEEHDLGFLFAPTIFIGDIDNHPIYAQPLCKEYSSIYEGGVSNEELNNRYSIEKKDLVSSYCSSVGCSLFNENWLIDVLDWYGEHIMCSLLVLLDTLNIGDFHDNNIGYLNKRPVLIDYSGYGE